ncbi:uncharacterized protein ColSpa_06061 [Colletotrichum spaethianum]|uniref:Uncharacterized protein n=1 Tax=Colletotrichum spaethianum TaxID=700344 RepID=A0AA37LH57_9PEZI|nr:uncharacterized protein ColSpa_06061 [Colletotrichum spaethianum]GKT45880.1 hypothetical protein ColSpa_06061 [Colletotrichum spaethianum]
MQLFIAKITAIFLLFSFAFANLHDSCKCRNSESDNSRMTTSACETYSNKNYKWGKSAYDAASGLCIKSSQTDQIAGNEWEAACREVAVSGFPCADGKGHCTADPNEVRGKC